MNIVSTIVFVWVILLAGSDCHAREASLCKGAINVQPDTIELSSQQLVNLRLLAEVWGFLKYHQSYISEKSINMDDELFKILPSVEIAENNTVLSKVLEKWVDVFPTPAKCQNCHPGFPSEIQQPAYGDVFNNKYLSLSLINKLKNILATRPVGDSYYFAIDPSGGNPIFRNELPYGDIKYPNVNIRLLTLFRYWNIIQYFYPYKHLIGTDWENILNNFIPVFIKAGNKTEYLLATLKMISACHDSHADIGLSNEIFEKYRGVNSVPFQCKFIDKNLVVTGFYLDTLNVRQVLKLGDIITVIDGFAVDEVVKKYSSIVVASNNATFYRDLCRNYLFRTNKANLSLEIISDGKKQEITVGVLLKTKINNYIDFYPKPDIAAFQVFDRIGYLFAGKYKNSDLPSLKKAVKETKGLIIDMRTYPSDQMNFTLVPYLKQGNQPSVKVLMPQPGFPGTFKLVDQFNPRGKNSYKGKIIVLVNETTQSQGEYVTMGFQSSSNVTVVGSQTAGTDGPACPIALPGGINTYISGVGILYPNGTETQRIGVKIDVPIAQTLKGITSGTDDLLEKAKQLIANSIK